jgi:hypothetical protein
VAATIRPLDYDRDTPEVVRLLQTSLSAGKSAEWLRWKHQDNPAGVSPAFVAEMDGEIVGARFFLCWNFRRGSQVEPALRPVDTVTHPKARGQGIFKRLTLQGLEVVNPGQQKLIFNTPNGNSLPGYVKMGWQVYPRDYAYYYALLTYLSAPAIVRSQQPPESVGGQLAYPADALTTDKSYDFLAWRYRAGDYTFAHFGDRPGESLVYRIIRVKGVPALSVADHVGTPESLRPLVEAAAAAEGLRVIHFLDGAFARAEDWQLRLRRGSSLVAVRTPRPVEQLNLRLSAGDLESVL